MPNRKYLKILDRGVEAWNSWRKDNPDVFPDFREADLRNRDLRGYDLSGLDLSRVNFHGSDLSRASLKKTILFETDFCRADLYKSDFSSSDLTNANLKGCQLAETDLRDAKLINCEVYGSSAWGLQTEGTVQTDLVISHPEATRITVDNIEVAQFIHLLLNNHKLRSVIDTIGKKAVLILGRFTFERKAVLEALRCELRKHELIPIMFDFQKPTTRNLTETVSLLAHMSRFIVADITDAKSIPQELQRIVPSIPSVPVAPILVSDSDEFGMFVDFDDYPWVLPVHKYEDVVSLLASLREDIIEPCEMRAQETEERRRAAQLAI